MGLMFGYYDGDGFSAFNQCYQDDTSRPTRQSSL